MTDQATMTERPETSHASTAYSKVVQSCEAIKNDETETIATWSPGDVVRQGDIYIVCLDKPLNRGKPTSERQLAPGNTQGSRHVAEGDCDMFTTDSEEAMKALNRLIPATKGDGDPFFFGPEIRARGPVEITHPEHGNRIIPAGSVGLVVYQRAYAEVVRRQQD